MSAPSRFPLPLPLLRAAPLTAPQRLHAGLRAQRVRLQRFALPPDDADLATIERMVGEVRALTADTVAVLDDVGGWYNVHDPTAGTAAEPLVDTATLGRMELANALAAMLRAGGEARQRVAACDSLLHAGRRCLRALDELVADAEGLDAPVEDSGADVDLALAIRRVYVDMHRAGGGGELPDTDTLRARLRASGNAIARTLGSSIAASIRVHDRHMMRSFQRRIRAGLAAGDDDVTADRLLRLWQDLTSFTSLLLDVNKREELRTHDRDLLLRMRARLDTLPAHALVPRVVTVALRACEGRDHELDTLLDAQPAAGPLRQVIQRVCAQLAPSPRRRKVTTSGTWSGLV